MLFALTLGSVLSCNAILDNPEGYLADDSGESGAGNATSGGRGGRGGGGGRDATGGVGGSAAQGGVSDGGMPDPGGARGGAEPTAGEGSGGDGGSPPTVECTEDEECAALLPETTPPDCADARCNPETQKCEYFAKDADDDEHAALNCTADGVTIEVGDDCDDEDPEALPGAWDGPASEDESRPDRCDDVDQNCDGTPDNEQVTDGGETKSCACDPDNPRPCFEYPNGAPIPANTLNVGVCKQGQQACVDGVPGSCVGAVGPRAMETCNGEDDDCDGQTDNDAIDALLFCQDRDGDGYCTSNCVLACDAPEGFREKSSCASGIDCNDNGSAIHPGANDLCGDGVDSNCTGGDNDAFPDLGSECFNGTYGVCRRRGTKVCSTDGRTTTCNARVVSASGPRAVAATDTDIDLSSVRTGYDPRWDWNCDNAVTAELGSQGLWEGTFRSRACEGNYEIACNSIGSGQCNDGVLGTKFFTCTRVGGNYAAIPVICGTAVNYVSCLYEFYDVGQCDYVLNSYVANNQSLQCQ